MRPATIIELPRLHTAKVKMEDGNVRALYFRKLRPCIAIVKQINLIFDQANEFGDLYYAPTDSMKMNGEDVHKYVMDDSVHLTDLQKQELEDLFINLLMYIFPFLVQQK